jgi:hypothetical protein
MSGISKEKYALENRFRSADFKRNIWHIIVAHDVVLEELLHPDYWRNVAAKVKLGDRIEVELEDSSAFFEFYVKDRGSNWLRLALMREVRFSDDAVELPENPDYTTTYKGRIKKWCIIRNVDNQILREGFEDRIEASKWLADYVRVK